MKLYVHKYPDLQTLANCREVADDAVVPSAPLELLTVAEFAAWQSEPTQVQWLADRAAEAEAVSVAAETELQADKDLVKAVLAASQAMIDGTGTTAERQRRVELGLGRLLQFLVKRKRELFQ